MADPRSTFCVVTTLETAPAQEAAYFVDELHRRQLNLGAVIVNKALPSWLLDEGPAEAAAALRERAPELGSALAAAVDAPPLRVGRVLTEVGESFDNYTVVAKREAEQRAELAATAEVLVTVPILDEPVNDLASLIRLGQCCWR
jgi:hypothetical protein